MTVKVEDDATDDDIYDEIVNTYIRDDYEIIEQYIQEITDIKVHGK